MSSTQSPPDASRSGHIRRALRRITTTFRRADGASHEFEAEIPASSASSAHVTQTQGAVISDSPAGPSQVHNNALLAADNTLDDYPPSFDPSMQDPSDFVHGEWTLDRATAHAGRAQRLMSRYGLKIEQQDSCSPNLPPVVHRVQRAPRMRLHRACHQCGVEFSHHKKCRACGHDICKRCPRSEGRRARASLDGSNQANSGVQTTTGRQVVESEPSATVDQAVRAGPSTNVELVNIGIATPSLETSDKDFNPNAEGGLTSDINMLPRPGLVSTAARPETLEIDQVEDISKHPSRSDTWDGKDSTIFSADPHLDRSQNVEITHGESRSEKSPARRSWSGEVSLPQESASPGIIRHQPAHSRAISVDRDYPSATRSVGAKNSLTTPERDQTSCGMGAGLSAVRSVLDKEHVTSTSQSRLHTAGESHECGGRPEWNYGQTNTSFDDLLIPDETSTDLSSSLILQSRGRASIHYLPMSAAASAKELRLSLIASDGQPGMFPAVQRVYRKPRQRIRYMCHQCNTSLLQIQTCGKCGHRRCDQCRRRPALKDRREPDPQYVQAFERRLAEMHRGLRSAAEHGRAAQAAQAI